MSDQQWIFASQPSSLVRELSSELKVSPLVSRILINRGIDTPLAAENFLRPTMDRLHDPLRLGQMEAAVARIRTAIERGEHIRTQGDYDVDGSTSCALLDQFFELVGGKHSFEIPRRSDGYGLSKVAIDRAKADKVDLLITVDNGISAHEEIAYARSLGMDVIVTDHHTIGDTLPPANVIVHPGLPGHDYPFDGLCGCAVAFKLTLALASSYGDTRSLGAGFTSFLENALALVAIASICDVVSLHDENRILVRHGLAALESATHPGLRALVDVSGVSFPLSGEDIGFRLGPRLNAGGRMGFERLSAELLTCRDHTRAQDIAAEMDRLNTQRQRVERKSTKLAKAQVDARLEEGSQDQVLVVADEDFAQGVVGIVAARLVDSYHKPALVLALDTEKGVASGSGRSTKDFHLLNALKECESYFLRYGGHAQAAGVTIEADKIDGFRTHLNQVAERHRQFVSAQRLLSVDAVVDQQELTLSLAHELMTLEPYGQGNPEPLLALEAGKIVGQPRIIGKTGKHVSFFVSSEGGPAFRAIGFGLAKRYEALNSARGVDLVFCPRISTFTGEEQLEIEIRDFAPRR